MKTIFLIPLPVVALAAVLCAPSSASAQSVLLSADEFAIIGQTAITNSAGPTVITGNVAISPNTSTSITGFAFKDPPGPNEATVTGLVVSSDGGALPGTAMNLVDGTTAAQALGDFHTAFTALNSMPTSTGDNFTNQDLGGKTLLPGVYTSATAATQALSTILTLNANFQNNVFWVFQITGTLISGANTQVHIINAPDGGASDGIFWDVSTGITFGSGDVALGNYLAGTAITFGATTSGVGGGRFFAQTSISIDSSSITSNPGANPKGWTGGLRYSSPTHTTIVPIPEPAAFLWLAPLSAIGFAAWRRRAAANKTVA